jgi:hypothetical protein
LKLDIDGYAALSGSSSEGVVKGRQPRLLVDRDVENGEFEAGCGAQFGEAQRFAVGMWGDGDAGSLQIIEHGRALPDADASDEDFRR